MLQATLAKTDRAPRPTGSRNGVAVLIAITFTAWSGIGIARTTLLGLVAALAAVTSAVAQARPSTVRMTCAQARGLVVAHGGIVLGTGGYTYDRFVAHRGFCLITEVTRAAWVPTRDAPQCFVGYTCIEAEPWFDR
jgi:hypothetical protein